MIFFISGPVGIELITFIYKKYKKDIKGIVVDKSEKLTIKFLKKNLQSCKIIFWDKKNNQKLLRNLVELKPSKFFLLWWPYILKKKFIIIPKYETINIHPSYLPFFKGKDSNFWSIINNGPFGVSIHRVNLNIDSGTILYRKKINKIDFTYDAKDLYRISQQLIINLFKEKYKILRKKKLLTGFKNKKVGKINKRIHMLKKSKINLKKNYKGEDIINLLRAKNFPPNDGIILEKNKKKYSININIKLINSK